MTETAIPAGYVSLEQLLEELRTFGFERQMVMELVTGPATPYYRNGFGPTHDEALFAILRAAKVLNDRFGPARVLKVFYHRKGSTTGLTMADLVKSREFATLTDHIDMTREGIGMYARE